MAIKFEMRIAIIVSILILAVSFFFVRYIWADSYYSESSESKPAVSRINAKAAGGYADFDADSTKFGTISATLPLTHRFGLAIDGLGGDYSADSLWGVGGTLFWRNPDKGLLGIVGSNVQVGANNAYRTGATAELYLGQFSVLGEVGYMDGDNIHEGVFTDAQLRWYVIENLALGAGCAYENNVVAGLVNMEYMPNLKVLPGLALFVDGSWGESGYHSVIAGARYYFGGSGKSLKQKHREDDPPNSALNGLALAAQGGAFEEIEEDTGGGTDDIVDDVIIPDIILP